MVKFIIKRLLLLIPILFGISIIIFCLLRLNGTSPVLQYLVVSGIAPTAEAIEETTRLLGLDKPVFEQYVIWLKGVIHLDFGKSYMTQRDVFEDMLYYLPNTIKLASFALLLTLVLSVPLGILSAVYKDRFPDYITRAISFLGVSTPNFWLGFLLIMFFSVYLNWLPPLGMGGIEHIIMPSFAIAFMSIAINARVIRVNMLEVKNQRHVTYAKMRGLKEKNVVVKHIFYNSLLPIVTIIGMHIGELIGGTLIIESVFAWPGVGRYAISAISNSDFPVIQCFVVMMCLIFIICNLIIDILYALLDPRIRLGMETSS